MTSLYQCITQLYSIRNQYGDAFASKKVKLLGAINKSLLKQSGKKALQLYYDTLLFLIAYPDNKTIYTNASQSLSQLYQNIRSSEQLKTKLFNTGITHTSVSAAFSFEMVKWLRKKRPANIKINSFDADEGHIQYILSAVMPKVESEILQDANEEWRGWLEKITKKGDLLDQVIAIFDATDIRPEVKDELWNAMGMNVEINLSAHCVIPPHLIIPFYHRSLNRQQLQPPPTEKPRQQKLTRDEAEHIIDCSRKILVRHLREIDPISFTAPEFVTYYHLERGISIALMGMVPDRRHPIDSYMGYTVFKNGLPVAYAGSWILFDSARIGLNVFPSFRGGESQYIFQQVLHLHSKVYRLKRFSVDPYQIGKENSDGIRSGAFWLYYYAGFRPILKKTHELADAEALKIKSDLQYRSPVPILKKLAVGRLQIILSNGAVQFDAVDLSRGWAGILARKYNNDRLQIPNDAYIKLAKILRINNSQEAKMKFILQNWSMLLLADEKGLRNNKLLQNLLKKLFILKATGREEEYIAGLQKTAVLRKYIEELIEQG